MAIGALSLGACAPAMDWREVRPEGARVLAVFPCKADGHARKVMLAGEARRLTLHACSAGDATWGLSFADVGDPGLVGTALDELRVAAAANVGATTLSPGTLAVPGATPNPHAGRWAIAGRLGDGRAVRVQVGVFARGTVVFQATVVGTQLEQEAVDTFFAGLRSTT